MSKHDIKLSIPSEKLKWLFAILFTEKEVFQLLIDAGLITEPDKMRKSTKNELLNILTEAFYNQSRFYEIIAESLAQKAETEISRVGYMVVDEIKTYFKSHIPLIESGDFGYVVWALIIDSREDVHAHGFHLMSTAYEANKDSEEVMNKLTVIKEYPDDQRTPTSEDQGTVQQYTIQLNEKSSELHEKHMEIERLGNVVDEIKTKQGAILKKNKRLEQHCKFLIEENERLKKRISTFQEKEEKLVLLQMENESLKLRSNQYAQTSTNLENLDAEHQKLLTKHEEITTQLQELDQFKASTESFMVELKLVEEAMFKENKVLLQLKSDIQNHFEELDKSQEESRVALNKIRMTIKDIEIPEKQLNTETENSTTHERVGVFVDVQNMFYAAKDRFERRVDYIKLLDLIVGPRELLCAYAYIVQIPEIKQGNFISLLEHNGYTIRSKDLRLRGDGSAKGDWDVGIAVDVVSMLRSLDVVILASGDGDFCPLAELIKQQQKRIEVVAFEHNTSMDLQAMADQFFPIGEELLM